MRRLIMANLKAVFGNINIIDRCVQNYFVFKSTKKELYIVKVGINSHFLLASNKFVRRGGEDQEDSIMS